MPALARRSPGASPSTPMLVEKFPGAPAGATDASKLRGSGAGSGPLLVSVSAVFMRSLPVCVNREKRVIICKCSNCT